MKRIPDSGSSGITTDDWLHELEALSRKSDEGHTASEMAEAFGKTIHRMRLLLARASALGWLHLGKRQTVRIDGKPTVVTVYRIVRPRAIVARGKRRG